MAAGMSAGTSRTHMSAMGQKRTCSDVCRDVRFTPKKRTSMITMRISVKCQRRTHALQQRLALFDHVLSWAIATNVVKESITFCDNHGGSRVVTSSVFDVTKSGRAELVSQFIELPRMAAASYRQQLRKSLAERIWPRREHTE